MEWRNDRAWEEVDLDAITHNFRLLRDCVSGIAMMPVIKAEAYGTGAVPVARALREAGAEAFAVATVDEAVRLRRAQLTEPLLVLGYTHPDRIPDLLAHDVSQSLYAPEQAALFAQALAKLGRRLRVHIKVDTGMRRSGFDAAQEILDALAPGCFDAEGVFTHFAAADEPESSFTCEQYDRLRAVLRDLAARGKEFRWNHCCSSPGIINFPEFGLNMARPGLSLYGYCTDPTAYGRVELREAVSVRARVSSVKQLHEGDTIGYGRTYTVTAPIRVATVPIGYADGMPRTLSGNLFALVHGVRCPLVGRVCMDYVMVDVTAVPGEVRLGDVVTLLGTDGGEHISLDDWANKLGTCQQEVLCDLSARLPRIYFRDGKPVSQLAWLDA